MTARARLERRIAELPAMGGKGTAVTRLGLSREEQLARSLVGDWLTARGARVRRDAAANLFARFGGDGPAVLVGSHLDSVPDGGRFDGALGVLCAIEAVESLMDLQAPLRRPVEVVGWADEEGARFGVGLFGSAAAFGRLAPGVAERRDRDGVSVEDALRSLGECVFSLDVRAAREHEKLVQRVVAEVERIAHARALQATVDELARVPVTPLDRGIALLLRRAVKDVGVDAELLVSGAGHDAQNAQLSGVPTGMIFVRSSGGSHTPREFASLDDAALGARALAVALRELAA